MLLLVMLAYPLLTRKRTNEFSAQCSLWFIMAFVAMSGASVALGRATFEIGQMFSSRYGTLVLLFWTAGAILAWARWRSYCVTVICTALAVLVLMLQPRLFETAHARRSGLAQSATANSAEANDLSALSALLPDPTRVLISAKILRIGCRFTVFRGPIGWEFG